MKSAAEYNSATIYAVAHGAVIVKAVLCKIDRFLGMVNRDSCVSNVFGRTLRRVCDGFGRLYAGAVLLVGARDIVGRFLRAILKTLNGFLCNVYHDSCVMSFFGTISSGSVWAR